MDERGNMQEWKDLGNGKEEKLQHKDVLTLPLVDKRLLPSLIELPASDKDILLAQIFGQVVLISFL